MLEWGISMSEEHDIISMLPLEHDFEIEPVQKDIDFEKGYTKVRLTKNQKMQISAATQQLPGLAAGMSMTNAYVARFPDGINHTLVSLKSQGGSMSMYMDSNGKFAGTASLYPLKIQAMFTQVFSVMAIASSQYYITEINSRLQMINQNLDKILEFLYGDKKAELLSEVSFIKYAYENYASIMTHTEQRTATIGSIQNAKIVAMKDIEFYMHDLETTVNDKANVEELVTNSFRIKESLELSIQLYGMSSVLEAYYSENQDKEYIAFIEREVTTYIDKCEKRMLSSFSTLRKYINDYKGRLLEKIDKTQYEKSVGEVIDSLNNGEESDIRKSLRKTLHAVTTMKEFYISKEGDVYLKVV
jgi:hypothetical protein